MRTDSRHPKARVLRSCSTAAVREAALTISDGHVHVMAVDDPGCDAALLSGRGVRCTSMRPMPSTASGPLIAVTDCQVDRLVPTWRGPDLRTDREAGLALGPGHESLFSAATLPYQFGQRGRGDVTVNAISILAESVVYGVRLSDGSQENLTVRPHLAGRSVDGTVVESARLLSELPETSRPAITELADILRSRITPLTWLQAYTEAEPGIYGPGPPRDLVPMPSWGFLLSGQALLFVLVDLVRRARRFRGIAPAGHPGGVVAP